jgi:hypothetical protein
MDNTLKPISYTEQIPCICSVYDIGCKVLSMKMNYLASFKHKHKHQKLVMKISYPTFIIRESTGQSSMDNPETRTMLGTRHRTNTKKNHQKEEEKRKIQKVQRRDSKYR